MSHTYCIQIKIFLLNELISIYVCYGLDIIVTCCIFCSMYVNNI